MTYDLRNEEPDVDPRADLDERALRRYDWIGGEPVDLNNGQAWVIPSLPLEVRRARRWPPWRRPRTEVEVGCFSADARVCERLLDGLLARPDEIVPIADQIRLCFHALRVNYRIQPAQATGLFDLKRCFWPIVMALLGRGEWAPADAPEGSARGGADSPPDADSSASRLTD